MRIAVLGAGGQVGQEFGRLRWPEGWQVALLGHEAADITDPAGLAAAVARSRPDLIVNLAAHTAVDRAEGERERAFAVNRDGADRLAALCADRELALIHLSTDYVFDGAKPAPYVEDDPVGPLNVYGASKEAGERAIRGRLARHVILRTSWVYGAGGANFVKTMLRLAAERDAVTVVEDQQGCPSWAADIAGAVRTIALAIAAGHARWGTYHYAGAGATSWAGFAEAILAEAAARGGPRADIIPIPTASYPTPALRPRNSRLDCGKILRDYGIAARPWREALRAMLAEHLGEAR